MVTKTPVSATVKKAVDAVLGESVLYKGSYANTTYCAANAGVTNDSRSAWGGSLPYLTSVESPGDKKTSHYGSVTSLSRKYVADRIQDYHNINPYNWDDDPAEWFGSFDCNHGLYVEEIEVCGRSLAGRQVREGLRQSKIKSAAFEVEVPVVAFELDIEALVKAAQPARPYVDVPAFPPIEVDQNFVVGEDVTNEKLVSAMTSAGGKLLEAVRLFDVYRDEERVGAGKKSMAYALTYRAADRTLTSEEVERAHERVVKKTASATGAEVRA